MTAPPAKIKACLATVKEKYLSENVSTATPEHMYQGLLTMELVLRGVLVTDEKKLWQQAQGSIGKSLLEEQNPNIPKPLLAGAHVLAGRVAEAYYNSCRGDAHPTGTTNTGHYYPVEETASALQRVKDLNDSRWRVLLQLQSDNNDCNLDPLLIAQGYYTRAALIQSDTPPMWKKVWDLWTNQSENENNNSTRTSTSTSTPPPFEAQAGMENLIRIAAAKRNNTRVAELQLKLIQSYLNPVRISSTTRDDKGTTNVAKAFGDSITSQLPSDPHASAQKAKSVFDECVASDLTTEADQITYQVLQVQVGIALEAASIEQMAVDQQKSDKNRSIATSLEDCRAKSQQQVWSSQLEDDPIHNAAITLRDTFVNVVWKKPEEEKDDDASSYWLPCLEMMIRSIERLHHRAKAQQQQSSNSSSDDPWATLLDFMLPLLETVQTQCGWSLTIPRRVRMEQIGKVMSSASDKELSLVSLLVIVLPNVYWMLLAYTSTRAISSMDETFKLVLDVVSVLMKQAKGKEQPTSAVGSKSQESSESRQWKLARNTAICCIGQGNTELIFQITKEAVASSKRPEHGSLGVLQCLIAWSGWYQRSWPYCANISDARRLLAATKLKVGRPLSTLERVLLDLAHADAELLNGGFPQDAWKRYEQVLQKLESLKDVLDELSSSVLQAHCLNGLARVCQLGESIPENGSVEEFAQKCLASLESIEMPPDIGPLHIWHSQAVFTSSLAYQMSISRQLIAESLVQQDRCEEAQTFLEAAVNDAPLDADAALALGAFLLRTAFYAQQERSDEVDKAAQIQLLKAAKLDSSKANPFALLGLWFEECGDLKRAQGCYTKSLTLDSCNPVAGRGLVRLGSRENIQQHLDTAIDSNSPLNGWAWRAVGLNKVFLDGEDEMAVVALLKSLRSRDVALPVNEPLGIFYQRTTDMDANERADALAELAMCYRRLGRFTASIRAFHAAIESAGENVASSVLCACAQVELELTLVDDAVDKFARVLEREEESVHSIAAYGQGVGLLSIARRDLEDGKAGSAYVNIQRAVESCLSFSSNFACSRKLLGDLYSFGASVPPNVFDSIHQSNSNVADGALKKQLDFVSKGEHAYRSVLEVEEVGTDEEVAVLEASAICDAASNIMLQAQIASSRHDIGITSETESIPEIKGLYERAFEEFQTAIESYPLHAPAWCGLGCAVLVKDPLLAQHAFCRCLQIEKTFADAYANVGFLYTSQRAFSASESVMNALTQVADTPMMWMNRAFMLERNASTDLMEDNSKSERALSQAADAYRAALQVMKHPDAQLGLSITSRVMANDDDIKDGKASSFAFAAKRKDASSLIKEYMGATYRLKDAASVFGGVMSMEQAMEIHDTSWSKELLDHGQELAQKALQTEGLGSILNVDVVHASLKSNKAGGDENKEEENTDFPVSVSLQRQILHEPGRADLWLALAKSLIGSLDDNPTDAAVESALAAANRASGMLAEELVRPRVIHGTVSSFVQAGMISEALTLVHCLQGFTKNEEIQEEENETKEEDDEQIKDKEEKDSSSSAFILQRSLMMCPNNPLAREALKLA